MGVLEYWSNGVLEWPTAPAYPTSAAATAEKAGDDD
jgi:hypothetical protein